MAWSRLLCIIARAWLDKAPGQASATFLTLEAWLKRSSAASPDGRSRELSEPDVLSLESLLDLSFFFLRIFFALRATLARTRSRGSSPVPENRLIAFFTDANFALVPSWGMDSEDSSFFFFFFFGLLLLSFFFFFFPFSLSSGLFSLAGASAPFLSCPGSPDSPGVNRASLLRRAASSSSSPQSVAFNRLAVQPSSSSRGFPFLTFSPCRISSPVVSWLQFRSHRWTRRSNRGLPVYHLSRLSLVVPVGLSLIMSWFPDLTTPLTSPATLHSWWKYFTVSQLISSARSTSCAATIPPSDQLGDGAPPSCCLRRRLAGLLKIPTSLPPATAPWKAAGRSRTPARAFAFALGIAFAAAFPFAFAFAFTLALGAISSFTTCRGSLFSTWHLSLYASCPCFSSFLDVHRRVCCLGRGLFSSLYPALKESGYEGYPWVFLLSLVPQLDEGLMEYLVLANA